MWQVSKARTQGRGVDFWGGVRACRGGVCFAGARVSLTQILGAGGDLAQRARLCVCFVCVLCVGHELVCREGAGEAAVMQRM